MSAYPEELPVDWQIEDANLELAEQHDDSAIRDTHSPFICDECNEACEDGIPCACETAKALGFADVESMHKHDQWLRENGTKEFKAWLAVIEKEKLPGN